MQDLSMLAVLIPALAIGYFAAKMLDRFIESNEQAAQKERVIEKNKKICYNKNTA